jgi:steroid delta-isomerase-like uncharacterized protein
MDVIPLLRTQLQSAAQYLEGTMADVTAEMAQQLPPGKAHTIAGYYAHYVITTDMLINAVMKGGAPLFATTWAGRTGANEPMPMPDANWAQSHEDWARSVQVDLPAMRQYATAVYAAADEYIASLTPEALDQMVNLPIGQYSLGWALSMTVINHISNGTARSPPSRACSARPAIRANRTVAFIKPIGSPTGSGPVTHNKKEKTMSTEQNKAAARRIYDECFNKGNLAAVDELVDPGTTDHNPTIPNQAPGAEGFKQLLTTFRTSFPDLHFTVEDIIAEGDKVVVRWTSTGTDTGGFAGMPPTGITAGTSGIDTLRFANGKVVERWGVVDFLSLLQQLGVIPTPGQ